MLVATAWGITPVSCCYWSSWSSGSAPCASITPSLPPLPRLWPFPRDKKGTARLKLVARCCGRDADCDDACLLPLHCAPSECPGLTNFLHHPLACLHLLAIALSSCARLCQPAAAPVVTEARRVPIPSLDCGRSNDIRGRCARPERCAGSSGLHTACPLPLALDTSPC